CTSRQQIELLEMLFPDGLDQLPRLSDLPDQASAILALAQGYLFSGQPRQAIALFRRANTIYSEIEDHEYLSINLSKLSDALCMSGAICESEAAACRALTITREQDDVLDEPASLRVFGLALASRGVASKAELALKRSLRMCISEADEAGEAEKSEFDKR